MSSGLTLTLLRGLPGSGKSTLARKMDAVHLEADMYFLDNAGVYTFQPSLLKKAHLWCETECESLLKKNKSVVISNTFVKQWEMSTYRNLAKQYQAKLVIKVCTGKYQSIHGVPAETIKKMQRQWQD
ncbi:AAA family ATPase [Psychromonas sp. KJ10-10]|uniref:AAA family ATPase n=1 Tax=Psychromonas sp. KJ10-10 TaxID=3391823 RepID=UPI0039B52940